MKDELKAFQANLLSLISHELRTPLTGILNALSLLEEKVLAERPAFTQNSEFSYVDLVAMARRNAQGLNYALASLLDLAAIESGTFSLRLKEGDLSRVLKQKLDENRALLMDHGISVDMALAESRRRSIQPVLIDPKRVGRTIDLCLRIIVGWMDQQTHLRVQAASHKIELEFSLKPLEEDNWDRSWRVIEESREGGRVSSVAAFRGILASEAEFLARTQEGLGSEFFLIHEIMRKHRGEFKQLRDERKVRLALELPVLNSFESLRAVLLSRIYESSTELSSVALILARRPQKIALSAFVSGLKKSLFRASDAVYELGDGELVAILLDDCKATDVPSLLSRIEKQLRVGMRYSAVVCPEEGVDPELIIELARKRLTKKLEIR